MILAFRQRGAIKLPWCLPLAESERLKRGCKRPRRGRGGGGGLKLGVSEEGERRGRAERMEPFSEATGVENVLSVIELEHQLVMRPSRLGGQLGPAGAPANHHSPSRCLFCLFACLIGLIAE